MKFFAIVLSIHLILSPLGLAKTTNTPTTSNTQTAHTPEDANNVGLPQNPVYDTNSQIKQGGFEFYGKQGLSIANAIIGSNIISQCSFGTKLTSINLFWAGTVAYIASEINAGGKDQNNDQNQYQSVVDKTAEELKKLKGGGDGDVQREIIEKRLADELRTSKFIKDRITWLTAVMAVYTAAATAAMLEETNGKTAGVSTGTNVCDGLASKYAAMECAGKKHYAACYRAKYSKHMEACTGSMPNGWAQTLPNFYRPDSVPIAQASCTGTYMSACTTYLQSYLGLAYANCTPFAEGTVIAGISLAKIITAAYSIGITSTSGNSMAPNIVMMYGLLEFLIPSLAKNVMAAYNYPIPRAVTFGALAALVGMIISGLQERLDNIITPNIQKLTLLRDDFVLATNENGGLSNYNPPDVNPEILVQKPKEIPPNNNLNTATTLSKGPVRSGKLCVTSNNNQLNFTDKDCAKPLVISKVTIPSAKGPSAYAIKKTQDMGIDMANDIANGNLDQAKGIAGQIGDMMDSVQDAYANAQADLRKSQQADGINPYDFKEGVRKELARLQDEFKSVVNSNDKFATIKNTDLGLGFVQNEKSNWSAMPIGSASISEKEKTEAKNKPEVKDPGEIGIGSADGKGSQVEARSSGSTDIFGGIEKTTTFGNNLSEDELNAATSQSMGYSDFEERMKIYSKSRDGILPTSEFSLFKQISYRYYKSYDKILERKKKPDGAQHRPKKTNSR